MAVDGVRSKSWDEFTARLAAAVAGDHGVRQRGGRELPVFFGGPGAPAKCIGATPDPSNAEGGDAGKRRAFELTRQALGYRMLQLLALPVHAGPRRAPAGRAGPSPPT